MDIETYTKFAKRTRADLDEKFLDNLHMLLGLGTEVGELQDIFKKALAYCAEIDWTNVEEELGDIMWYLANFCDINGLDFGKILEKNIIKLGVRYPIEFSSDSALLRNLQEERKVLEGKGSVTQMSFTED